MISGEYEIEDDKTEYAERSMTIKLHIVTDENSVKGSSEFLSELERLLKEYAI